MGGRWRGRFLSLSLFLFLFLFLSLSFSFCLFLSLSLSRGLGGSRKLLRGSRKRLGRHVELLESLQNFGRHSYLATAERARVARVRVPRRDVQVLPARCYECMRLSCNAAPRRAGSCSSSLPLLLHLLLSLLVAVAIVVAVAVLAAVAVILKSIIRFQVL